MTSAALRKPLLLLAASAAVLVLGAQGSAQTAKPKKGNWGAMVAATDGGHLLGNPDAPARLIEFMSYTCSHCAEFARTGDGAIKLAYVPTGKVNFEIRHLLRDPVDLTAALLTHCGDTGKFPANHAAMMARHGEWMATARATTPAQRSRWQFGSNPARFQAIASDLGFYDIMEGRGYTRPQVDVCLSDEAKANALAETSRADTARYKLQGTPSFVLNGALLENTHAWEALQPHLDEVI